MECGTNKLLKHGAMAVTDARDIISKFKELEYNEELAIIGSNPIACIPEKYREMYSLLKTKSIDVNEISRILKKPVNEVSSMLFMMEIEEYIDRNADGTYRPKEE